MKLPTIIGTAIAAIGLAACGSTATPTVRPSTPTPTVAPTPSATTAPTPTATPTATPTLSVMGWWNDNELVALASNQSVWLSTVQGQAVSEISADPAWTFSGVISG